MFPERTCSPAYFLTPRRWELESRTIAARAATFFMCHIYLTLLLFRRRLLPLRGGCGGFFPWAQPWLAWFSWMKMRQAFFSRAGVFVLAGALIAGFLRGRFGHLRGGFVFGFGGCFIEDLATAAFVSARRAAVLGAVREVLFNLLRLSLDDLFPP